MEAISILGREVMLPRGLTGLGTDTLDQSKLEVNEVRLLSPRTGTTAPCSA